MIDKCVVIFVEGETEEAFYQCVKNIIRLRLGGSFDCKVELKNVKGISNYKKKVSRIFSKQIIPKYPGHQLDVILCYDTDVFELSQKPPVDWHDVKKDLKKYGARKVELVGAKKSIEDWFLKDIDGIIKYLRLPKSTIASGESGAKELEKLFKKANKIYIKGKKSAGFVEALDVEYILQCICSEIKPLCVSLGLKCTKTVKECSDKSK